MTHTTSIFSISKREYEILDLLSKGFSSQDIAHQLYLSPYTIKDHRKSLLIKLNARNAAQMIRKAFEHQLLQH